MRNLMSIFICLFTLSCTGNLAVAGDVEPLKILIIKNSTEITAKDIEKINLTYSKQAGSFFASIKFLESGEKKLEEVLKSNINNQISILMGNIVVAVPVPIKTEKAFNPLTFQIDDEEIAIKLLKLKSE